MRPTTQRAGPAIDNVTLVVSAGNAGEKSSPERSRASGFAPARLVRPLGIYIHFPWCLVKCPYCDFVAFRKAPDRIDHERYADAVLAELDARVRAFGDAAGRSVCSIFFGGGTPSLWRATELGRVLRAALGAFETAENGGESAAITRCIEISVECDPVAFDEARVGALVEQGVGRVSLGVQSFDDRRLSFLGRAHTAEQARAAIRTAVRGRVPHVAVDLLYAVPGLSPEDAATEAARAIELGATHVSAYSLTIEPSTVFGRLARQNRLPLVEDSLAAESFQAVHEALTGRGLEHYEISNYGLPGHRSVHNIGYWIGQDYLGLGCGAVGTLSSATGATRYRNEPHPQRYLDAVAALAGASDPERRDGALEALAPEREELDPTTRLRERIMLGLRTAEGLDLDAAGRDCGLDPWTPDRERAVRNLAERGRLVRDGGRIRIPVDAWIWADGTASALF